MVRIFLSLGSNLQRREDNLFGAVQMLNDNDITIKKISAIYESNASEPIKFFHLTLPMQPHQNRYLNCVLEADTNDEPNQLLTKILKIEKTLGRKRYLGVKNLPRPIDIDILFYDKLIINRPNLQVPHPRLHLRDFVLLPLAELAPDFVHPILNKPIKQLVSEIKYHQGVSIWQKTITTPSP
ncbi:MAG: 2-amino-4-hydroxy-6-hydroxymethyldihydropteridine diphosphokinase [candidate division WOR-3 bacterium]